MYKYIIFEYVVSVLMLRKEVHLSELRDSESSFDFLPLHKQMSNLYLFHSTFKN